MSIISNHIIRYPEVLLRRDFLIDLLSTPIRTKATISDESTADKLYATITDNHNLYLGKLLDIDGDLY